MPTITISMPMTATVWVSQGGNDVGTWSIAVLQDAQVLLYILAIVLGLATARWLMP